MAMSGYPQDVIDQGFERDRQDYWAMRDELLAKYPGKWVAVHKGRVVAVGDDPLSLMDQALAEDGYAYTNKVGEEDRIVSRQRRVSFPYDATYGPTPLPRITAILHNFPQTTSKTLADAIPDTGADVTCLPEDDCRDLGLFLFPYYSSCHGLRQSRGCRKGSDTEHQTVGFRARVEEPSGALIWKEHLQRRLLRRRRRMGTDACHQRLSENRRRHLSFLQCRTPLCAFWKGTAPETRRSHLAPMELV